MVDMAFPGLVSGFAEAQRLMHGPVMGRNWVGNLLLNALVVGLGLCRRPEIRKGSGPINLYLDLSSGKNTR